MKIVLGGVLLIGGVLLGGWLVSQQFIPQEILMIIGQGKSSATVLQSDTGVKEKEILYWVAPMDPNYRRDKPGQSPMGMDLIPVYAGGEDNDGDNGADVTISAAVVNNLGVRTASVKHVDLERRIDTVGYVSFDETQINHIHLRTDGWVERLVVKAEGERVKKGQLLFEFYSPTLVNAQEEFLQSVSAKNKKLVGASELRLQSLGMSRYQIDQIRKAGKIRLRVAVHAPQDGIVSKLNVRQGMQVTPKNTIMSLADLKHVWLQTEVYERQSNWVTLGGRAEARLAYLPEKTWKGQVDYIYPTLTAKTRTLKVRLRFLNPEERMKPNMYAKVSIYGAPKKNTLAVPREAVIRSGQGERIILALGEGRFQAKKIRTGMESNGLVEILSGLENGDKVVTSAQFLIDSQASLSGSLERMEEVEEHKEVGGIKHLPATESQAPPISSAGVLRMIMPDERKVKLSHEPIPALNWPAMTMDFTLADEVEVPTLDLGAKIRFEMRALDEYTYEITKISADHEIIIKAHGTLRQILTAENKVNITHAPIPELQWPTMTMNFPLASGVSVTALKPEQKVVFQLRKIGEFEYEIIQIQAASVEAAP
ncbi:MAG: efflux RND transporter periplasmic adaptor subunit [Magnetococcales bacterium]|nr:efflux RND transporter periplasmic adaptor subunit [Magnetococcales bacterium]